MELHSRNGNGIPISDRTGSRKVEPHSEGGIRVRSMDGVIWVVDPFIKRVVLVEGVSEWKLILRMDLHSQNGFPF